MKRMALFFLVLYVFVANASAGGRNEATQQNSALAGTLTVWSSGEELGRFIPGFNKLYPDIKVNITVVPNNEFVAKLTPTLASGQGAPDIYTGESGYVRYLVEAGFWEDLRNSPYNVQRYVSGIWDYVTSVGTDKTGAIRALSWQASPGSIIYRRDIARQYLGSDTPEAVHTFLSSNAKILETAAILYRNGIKMFASWQDLYNMQFSNRKQPWVVNNKLVLDQSMLDFMDTARTIVQNKYDLNVDPWAPEWIAAVEGNDTFCYVLPTWGYQFVVKPAANKTKGQWGLAEGPVPYVKGGTWLGIYKNSPRKNMAWAFLEYVTCNVDAQKAYAAEYGEYVALKAVNEALAREKGEEVLAGQNLFQFYNTQMGKIPNNLMTPYDLSLDNAFLSATKAYAVGNLSKDRAVQQFKEDALTAYPELDIQ